MPEPSPQTIPLRTVIREWGRIGAIGFGGPPAHIALFRRLCVEERGWLTAHEFEDGIAAAPVNLCETESVDNHCAVVASSFGSLIQATAGSSGGVGTFRTNRSGWAA